MKRKERATVRSSPPHLVAVVVALGSLFAATFAIGTGSIWLAAAAVILIGIASLLPSFLDYRQTRQALTETRHRARKAHAIERTEIQQLVKWPDSSGHTIH